MRAIKINKKDNVAVVIKEAKKGDVLEGMDITLLSDVPQGHKVALVPMAKGDAVIRYGVTLGYLTEDVEKGAWINEKMLTLPLLSAEKANILHCSLSAPLGWDMIMEKASLPEQETSWVSRRLSSAVQVY